MNKLKQKMLLLKLSFVFLFLGICLPILANTRSYCEDIYKISIEEYRQGNYIKSLEYLQEIEQLAVQNNWKDMQTRALNNMGLVYMHILDYDLATKCYLDAYKIVMEIGDKITELSVLSNIAQLYFINNDIANATEYIDKAYKIAQSLDDTIRIGRIAINAAIIANETDQLAKANEYTEIAIKNLKNAPEHFQSLVKAKLEKVKTLYLQEEFDKAGEVALSLLNRIDEITFINGKSLVYLWLSRIYWKKNDIQQAILYANKSLDEKPALSTKTQVFEHLSILYRQSNLPLLALQYQDSLLIAKDSLAHINDVNKQENMQIRIELINSEKELAENKAKRKTERTIYIFIIIIAFILIWMLRLQSMRNKQRKSLELEIEKNEKLMLQQKLEAQQAIALLEKEKLNNEINEKNRQLAAKVLLQSNKNELVVEIVDKLSNVSKKTNNSDLDLIIQQLRMQSKETSEWDGFLTYFEQINPTFLSLLKEKHPNLSSGDIRLLSYIYINLDTKEIATLLNVTAEHCRKKKQRLAKKMDITTSDIYTYLVNLI
jgi:preprotein translocase subunit YajC